MTLFSETGLPLDAAAATRCAVVVEQKGDDPAECRQRVLAGCAAYQSLEKRVPNRRLVVVGGAAGDIRAETLSHWCAPFGVEPVVRAESHHTRDKAESVADFVREYRATCVIQVTSLYHSLRAYLTTTAALRQANLPVNLLNHVSDSQDPAAVRFCVLDEILLAKELEPRLGFDPRDEDYEAYIDAARALRACPGHQSYLARRLGEAQRIAAYSEAGSGHLVTDLPIKEILDSYPG
jgi:hypothetical protein